MTHASRVVVLGGSAVATPGLAEAITRLPDRTRPIELVLVGRDQDKLSKIAYVAQMLAGNDPLLTVEPCSDAESGLSGADIVINQIRVGGLEARVFDESFSQDLGLPGRGNRGSGRICQRLAYHPGRAGVCPYHGARLPRCDATHLRQP